MKLISPCDGLFIRCMKRENVYLLTKKLPWHVIKSWKRYYYLRFNYESCSILNEKASIKLNVIYCLKGPGWFSEGWKKKNILRARWKVMTKPCRLITFCLKPGSKRSCQYYFEITNENGSSFSRSRVLACQTPDKI